jgi:hypothetical protein
LHIVRDGQHNIGGLAEEKKISELRDDLIQATVCLEVARMHAKYYLALGIWDYSQWFPGKENIVANALSCNNDCLDKDLTLIFCSHCPSQIPDFPRFYPCPMKSSCG